MLAQPKKEWETALSPSKRMSSKGLDKVLDRMLTGTTGETPACVLRTCASLLLCLPRIRLRLTPAAHDDALLALHTSEACGVC